MHNILLGIGFLLICVASIAIKGCVCIEINTSLFYACSDTEYLAGLECTLRKHLKEQEKV